MSLKVAPKMPVIGANAHKKKGSISNFASFQVLGTLTWVAPNRPAVRVGSCLWKNDVIFGLFESFSNFNGKKKNHLCSPVVLSNKKDVAVRS